MYLVILYYDTQEVQVIRNIPDALEEDNLELFITTKLNISLDNISYMLVDEACALTYSTYDEKYEMLVNDSVDYFGQHF